MNEVKLDGPKLISLTPNQIAYVLDLLATRPWKEVNGLINEIMTQLKAQETMIPTGEPKDGPEPH